MNDTITPPHAHRRGGFVVLLIILSSQGCGLLLETDRAAPFDGGRDSGALPDGGDARPPTDASRPDAGMVDDRWAFRRPIVITADLVAGDLVDFPVFVSLEGDSHLASNAAADGSDIRFVKDDAVLDHELEVWDAAAGTMKAWVRVPSLASTADTVFYLYYGGPTGASVEFPDGVWNPAFAAVWHFSDPPGTGVSDSSGSGANGTPRGGPTSVDGLLGDALALDGVDDFVSGGRGGALAITGAMTVEVWFEPAGFVDDNDHLVGTMGSSDGTRGWDLSFDQLTCRPGTAGCTKPADAVGWVTARASEDGSTANIATAGYEAIGARWHHATFVLDPGRAFRLRLDDVPISSADTPAAIHDPGLPVTLGREPSPTSDSFFSGRVDELRISSVARSEAWLQTSYASQAEEGFLRVDPPEAVP